MPRFFTLDQARQLLPEVESTIRHAVFARSEYQEAESELQQATQRITMMGGTLVDRDRLSLQKSRREASALQLKEAVEKIHGLGCVIKDLDVGLVDFPTLYRGEEVYLCWKLGESGIGYWHGTNEGFAGRKQIDREFLDHHQGDLTN